MMVDKTKKVLCGLGWHCWDEFLGPPLPKRHCRWCGKKQCTRPELLGKCFIWFDYEIIDGEIFVDGNKVFYFDGDKLEVRL